MASASIRGIGDDGKAPAFDAAFAFPGALLGRARALAAEESARSGISVADGVRGLRAAYTLDRDRLGAVARTAHRYVGGSFFLVRDLPKAMSIAYELGIRGLLPARREARVLDLGAGFGTTTFGYARAARVLDAHDSLVVDAIDSDPGVLERMRALATPDHELLPLSLRTHATSLERFLEGNAARYDVVLVGLALNELASDLDRRVALVNRALGMLAPDGVLVVIEPALHATTRDLMELRDRLVGGSAPAFVASPCTHANACPMLAAGERDWCHVELDLALPQHEAAISDAVGLRDEKLTFAPLAIGVGDVGRADLSRLVSRPLGSKGKTETVACGASGLVRLRQLDRDPGEVRLADLRRGSLVRIEPEPHGIEAIRLGRDAVIRRIVG